MVASRGPIIDHGPSMIASIKTHKKMMVPASERLQFKFSVNVDMHGSNCFQDLVERQDMEIHIFKGASI